MEGPCLWEGGKLKNALEKRIRRVERGQTGGRIEANSKWSEEAGWARNRASIARVWSRSTWIFVSTAEVDSSLAKREELESCYMMIRWQWSNMRSWCLRVELDSNPFTSPIFVSRIRQRTGKEGLWPAICRSRAKVKVEIHGNINLKSWWQRQEQRSGVCLISHFFNSRGITDLSICASGSHRQSSCACFLLSIPDMELLDLSILPSRELSET